MRINFFFLITFLFVNQYTIAQTNWQVLQSNTILNLLDVQCLAKDTLFIFGDDGILLKSTDGGVNFTTHQNASALIYSAGYFKTLDTVFVANGGGNVMQTNNGGSSWNFSGGCTCTIRSICFANAQIGLFGSLSGVYRTNNGGASWTNTSMIPFATPNKIISLNDSIFLYTDDNLIFKSTNAGESFTIDTLNYGSSFPISGLSFIDDSIGFISSGDGKILKSINQGNTWNLIGNTGNNVRDIVFTDNQNGFAITGNLSNTILRSTDGGVSWVSEYTATHSIEKFAYDGYYVFAVGQDGLALKKELSPTFTTDISKNEINLFPNPCIDKLYLTNGIKENEIQIYNSIGQLVYTLNKVSEDPIDISNLKTGIYFLRVSNKKSTTTLPFSKL